MITLEYIIEAMNALGGHCCYKDLYSKIKELHPDSVDSYTEIKNWTAAIRLKIEQFSSCSDTFDPKNPDIFYTDEKGSGHWKLRNPEFTENTMDLTNDDEGFPEGKKVLRQHLYRERNHSLKTQAIKKFKDSHNGKLYCEICGFNFQEKYGDIGIDFIESHHIKPVSEMNENDKTKLDDIVLLCSNCHSMIHRKRPWLSKTELKKLLEK